ncbi:ABC transporter permease [Dethiothermospora halolimnae]|uniref:ABC transporter permease n=1 Tax=Dethiothermospora halolimnae TaxID=3114390 RepID=UPI003CCBA365
MNKTATILKREIKSYFVSPLAYVIISAYLVICGYFFTTSILLSKLSTMQEVFTNMINVMIFLTPLLTMGLLTEERKQGIDQLLFTTPLGVTEFVIGKYLSAIIVYITMLVITFSYPLTLQILGDPDMGLIISSYIGVLLVGGVFISIGLFASSLTESQIIAGIISFGILLFLWILTLIKSTFTGAIAQFIYNIDLFVYFTDFQKGIIDTRAIMICLSFIFIFLFLTTRVIDRRRWS